MCHTGLSCSFPLSLVDATFLLTIGSFRLTIELFYLQLCLGALLLEVEAFCLQLKRVLLTTGKCVS